MKKTNNKKIFLVIIGCFVFFLATCYLMLTTSSASAYTLLEPLPFPQGSITQVDAQGSTFSGMAYQGTITLSGYLKYLFNFALAAAAFLAVIQITIAGAQWIWAGASESVLSNAKGRIWDAIMGLILAFGSYLLLYTINPDLVNMQLTLTPVTLTPTVAPAALEDSSYSFYLTIPGNMYCLAAQGAGGMCNDYDGPDCSAPDGQQCCKCTATSPPPPVSNDNNYQWTPLAKYCSQIGQGWVTGSYEWCLEKKGSPGDISYCCYKP